ncbi:hypothetical protein F4Y59_15300 [Candidatus Poribacteria bacterium]|nr:hypothetical protein [Candidatus Poribacteria bacterium]MYK18527.1 hypothetical protein [Candidatus Poribacteria bacterium]
MKGTFNTETFKKTLRIYLVTFGVTWGILICSGFGIPLALETMSYARLAIGKIVSGTIAIGYVATGSGSIGIVACGILSAGIFAVGGTACGIVAIGGGAAFGVIAIGINAIGVVAIGYNAMGIYALSYKDQKNRSRYMFSPERQDAKAVGLFTRWMPKLKNAFATKH